MGKQSVVALLLSRSREWTYRHNNGQVLVGLSQLEQNGFSNFQQ